MPTLQHEIRKVFTATATKGANGTNVFTVSTGEVDRDGDTLDPKSWNLAAFKANPIVLYNHSRSDLPIAKCTDIRVVGGTLKATIAWPPAGVYPFADTVHALVDEGFLNAASVGFRADRSEPNAHGGRDHRGQELCEFSLVPIPSNPSALVERGLNRMQLKSWLGNSWHHQSREGSVMKTIADDEMYLEVSDDFFAKDLDNAFEEMLAMMNTGSRHSVAEDLAVQMRRLGPDASIGELCRAVMAQGVVAARSWAPETYDIDDRQLASLIGQVIAEEIPRATRAALNAAVGRLD